MTKEDALVIIAAYETKEPKDRLEKDMLHEAWEVVLGEAKAIKRSREGLRWNK